MNISSGLESCWPSVESGGRRRQILGTFAMSEPQGLVALPLDPGSYLANTSSLTLALV